MSKFIKHTDPDDQVEVLGANIVSDKNKADDHPPKQYKSSIIITVISVMILVCLAFVMWCIYEPKTAEPDMTFMPVNDTQITQVEEDSVPAPAQSTRQLHVLIDTINDVSMSLIWLDGTKASVTFDVEDTDDALLATPAADYRADNGDIVGEFIIDKSQISAGSKKTGWCYTDTAGQITIGVGSCDEAKRRALDEGGCFFRQYALVMDGQICPNILKGKAKRRALGFIDGKPVMIKSVDRESIYDFSQALADYGVSHAIYLPGSEGRWILQSDAGSECIDCKPPADVKINYLIFK